MYVYFVSYFWFDHSVSWTFGQLIYETSAKIANCEDINRLREYANSAVPDTGSVIILNFILLPDRICGRCGNPRSSVVHITSLPDRDNDGYGHVFAE